MRRVFFALSVLVLIGLAPRAASAATIIDPIIGVRGGDFGSISPTDGQTHFFGEEGACPFTDLVANGFVCLVYDISALAGGLHAITLLIEDAGEPATVFQEDPGVTCGEFEEGCVPQEPSQFNVDTEGLGPGQVRMSGDTLTCPNFETEGSHLCHDAVLYVKPLPGEVGIFSAKVLALNDQPVPEPGTFLLISTGLAAVVGRRFRRKAS